MGFMNDLKESVKHARGESGEVKTVGKFSTWKLVVCIFLIIVAFKVYKHIQVQQLDNEPIQPQQTEQNDINTTSQATLSDSHTDHIHSAVNKYLSLLRDGDCDSLFDMLYHYNQMISMESTYSPSIVIEKKREKYVNEWREACNEHVNGAKKNHYVNWNQIYITKNTVYKILEIKNGTAFVKLDYPRKEAYCDDGKLLKSIIKGVSYVNVDGNDLVELSSFADSDSKEYYDSSCNDEQDSK